MNDPGAMPPRDEAPDGPPPPIVASKVSSLIPTIAYGPIASRRLGHSMGVNLLPPGVKVCSFNCPYCECGWTDVTATRRRFEDLAWPAPEAVAEELECALRRCRDGGFEIAYVTLAGNGEPTLHPRFPECVEAVRAARDATFPSARVAVLSNATTLDDDAIVAALNRLDDRIMKVDAGHDEMIRLMNVPLCAFSIRHAVERFAALRDCIVQSMFVGGRFSNSGPAEVDAWIALVARARPRHAQLYTLERHAPDATLAPVGRERLDAIGAELTRRTGIEARVFG